MNKLEISGVTIKEINGKITYFLPEGMTGTKLKEFKVRNSKKINKFLKKNE
jgi:hypothetical protein